MPKITQKSTFAILAYFPAVFWIFVKTGEPDGLNLFSIGLVPFSPKF